jgi:lysophospholipase L1-like esterase
VATSKGALRFTWGKIQNANKYVIYRATEKTGEYIEIGSTKKNTYTDKSGKALHTYYYKVMAVGTDKNGELVASTLSKAQKAKVRKKAKKTAYVGDSIFTGFPLYGVIRNTSSHKVYAKVGINTKSFLSSDLMRKLLKYNPDRMFIMLGVNSLPGKVNSKYMDYILGYYQKIINQCLKKNPDMEIIVIGVAPVSRSANVRLSKVHQYNKKLKKMFSASKYKDNVHYCSLDSVLGDKSGYLPSKYSAGDGVHWKSSAYRKVRDALNDFAKEF